MNAALDWTAHNWHLLAVPGAVFVAALIATFWLRALGYERVGRWWRRTGWKGHDMLVQATHGPSAIWCLLVSAYLALSVSSIPAAWKVPIERTFGSLLAISMAFSAYNLARGALDAYGGRWKLPTGSLRSARNVARATVMVLAILTILDIWGLPLTALLIFLMIVALLAVTAFREAIAETFAGMQLGATRHVKAGDYVKLSTGELGEVLDIGTRSARIRTLDARVLSVPNSRLLQNLVNYGRPLKKATSPFRFYGREQVTELTGLSARNLRGLADILKDAPDSVVYYHTHHFLLEHHYLTPEPGNDFGVWVSDALRDEDLGERLAGVDALEFPTLSALKERLLSIMGECLARDPSAREAPAGREFHFLKSVSVIFPTPYEATDLRQFVEALRNVTGGSLYFHLFESRLRIGRGRNDFSLWIEENLGDKELAAEISRIDPYTYTLEGLRSSLIQLIEKRIK